MGLANDPANRCDIIDVGRVTIRRCELERGHDLAEPLQGAPRRPHKWGLPGDGVCMHRRLVGRGGRVYVRFCALGSGHDDEHVLSVDTERAASYAEADAYHEERAAARAAEPAPAESHPGGRTDWVADPNAPEPEPAPARHVEVNLSTVELIAAQRPGDRPAVLVRGYVGYAFVAQRLQLAEGSAVGVLLDALREEIEAALTRKVETVRARFATMPRERCVRFAVGRQCQKWAEHEGEHVYAFEGPPCRYSDGSRACPLDEGHDGDHQLTASDGTTVELVPNMATIGGTE